MVLEVIQREIPTRGIGYVILRDCPEERLGEALGLTWDCVDFQKNRLTINKQLQKGRWRMSVLRLLR